MEMISKNNIKWPYFFIIAINTFFGWQILKTFLSLLVNFYRERPDISLTDVGIYAVISFSLVFAAGFLFKLGRRPLLWVILGGVGLIRMILQLNSWPSLSLAMSAVGTILWLASFILFISLLQQEKIDLFYTFFPGLLFGISLATAVHGLLGTWDMVWRSDPFITADVILIVLVQLWLISRLSGDLGQVKLSDGRKTVFYTLAVLMPFIFLQLFKFQNIAALSAVTGFSTVISLTVVLASNAAAFACVYLFKFKKVRLPLAVPAAVLLVASFWPGTGGYLYVLQIFLGNISCFWLMIIIINKAVSISLVKTPWKNTAAIGLSGLLLFIFAFIYYGSYDMNLPFDNWIIPVFLAALIGICGIVAVSLKLPRGRSLKKEDPGPVSKSLWMRTLPLLLAIALLAVPLIMMVPVKYPDDPRDGPAPQSSVRVMDYNIHQGFNIGGYQDLESIARVIEGSGAEIVALQEVSRGWVINGSADTLNWLSGRLGMEYIYMPASDAIWGNAVLSKYPLKLVKSGFLPREGAPLRRSFLLVEVEIGRGKNINILCTHLHHIEGEGMIREKQVDELLARWNGLQRTIILGDFNAEPGDAEIEKMYQAGFIDSQLELGAGDQPTWAHYEPYERIDYIWVTPGLKISDLKVPFSTASDHLPIIINVE